MRTNRRRHPLDPTNKYLSHYCAEGPEPLRIYRGNVMFDANGEAWVQLPDYFESINRDYDYQITCVGRFAPVYVAEEIRDGRFKIAGGQPGAKVSWTVTGVRNDPFVRVYGAPVEMEKAEQPRGKYLHPELFDKPADVGNHALPELRSLEYGPPCGPFMNGRGERVVRMAGPR